METLGAVGFGVLVVWLFIRSIKRRANMTPEERRTERLEHEVRDLKREQRRQRMYQ